MNVTDQIAVPGSRPRYTQRPLPPYSYVPGHAPHPMSDPRGHMAGQPHTNAAPLDPERWLDSTEYLYGLDLFNHGYYWEAHETWEGLWHAAGRRGPAADWVKGLIKLAAAGVKAREGNAAGAVRHARRAGELFAGLFHEERERPRHCGLSVAELMATARRLASDADQKFAQPAPHLLLDVWLEAK